MYKQLCKKQKERNEMFLTLLCLMKQLINNAFLVNKQVFSHHCEFCFVKVLIVNFESSGHAPKNVWKLTSVVTSSLYFLGQRNLLAPGKSISLIDSL